MIKFLPFKDVRAKILQSTDFLFFFHCSQIVSYLCQKCKKIGSYPLRFRNKTCGKYLDFDKLAHVILHGLQGFIVENIEGESTEANDRSHIL